MAKEEPPYVRIAACRRAIVDLEREIARLSARIDHQQEQKADMPLVWKNVHHCLKRYDSNIQAATTGRQDAESRLQERQAHLREIIGQEREMYGGMQGPGEAAYAYDQHVRRLPDGGVMVRYNEEEDGENAEQRLGVSRMPLSRLLDEHATEQQARILRARYADNDTVS